MKPSQVISIALKLCVVICAIWGVWLNICTPDKIFGNPTALLYFTIQSNIWIMVTCLVGLVRMARGLRVSHTLAVLKLVFTVAITLTGVVYCTMLAPTIGPGAWALQSNLVHVVVPSAAILDFFVCSRFWNSSNSSIRKRRYILKGRDAWWVILPPLYYLGFAGIGYVCNWHFTPYSNYPYFFLNWGSPAGAFGFCHELPFMGVMWYVLALLIALVLVGKLYIRIASAISGN